MAVVNSGGAAAAGSYYMRQQAAARARREAELRRKNGIALLNAAKENNTAKVKSLLKQDTPLSFCDKKNYTALHYAVSHENEAIVVNLIANGANPMAASQNGPTPIEVAAEVGSGKLLNYLINQAYDDKLKFRRHETDGSIVEKARMLGHSAIIPLIDYILLHYPDSLNDKKIQIDLAKLINAFYSIATDSSNQYQDHCYRMGVFLQKHDAFKPYRAYAIAFLALANDYKKAKQYKAYAYLKVMKQPHIEYTASSLKEWLQEQELGRKSQNKLLQVAIILNKLPANALIDNEIGEIYELLGKNGKAFQFF